MSLKEYNEIIGQLYTEKLILEGKLEDMKEEKIEKYTDDINNLYQENQELRKTISDLNENIQNQNKSSDDNVVNLRKQLQDMTEKKNMYRNERYELKNEIKYLHRKIDELMRE